MVNSDSYLDFLERSLPTFNISALDNPKELISQFNFENNGTFVTDQKLGYLAQGDILTNLPFSFYDKESRILKSNTMQGVLLSNTCDAERREFLSFAPLIPIERITEGGNLKNDIVKKNEKNSLLYLPHIDLQEYVADLNRIFTVPREIVELLMEKDKIEKKYSLKQAGHYLLMTKLVVLFCRTESNEVSRIS